MTSAVTYRDVMNAIRVKDTKIATTRDGQGAAHACVVEMDTEPQSLERHPRRTSSPSSSKRRRPLAGRRHAKGITDLNDVKGVPLMPLHAALAAYEIRGEAVKAPVLCLSSGGHDREPDSLGTSHRPCNPRGPSHRISSSRYSLRKFFFNGHVA